MILVTMNTIYDGLIATLESAFPDIDVYGDEGAMDRDEPYIWANMTGVTQTKQLNNRYRRVHSFDIVYADPDRAAMRAAADKLYMELELIVIDGSCYRGTNMKHEIVEDKLRFHVDYTLRIVKEMPEEPLMQEMQQKPDLSE